MLRCGDCRSAAPSETAQASVLGFVRSIEGRARRLRARRWAGMAGRAAGQTVSSADALIGEKQMTSNEILNAMKARIAELEPFVEEHAKLTMAIGSMNSNSEIGEPILLPPQPEIERQMHQAAMRGNNMRVHW